MSRSKSPPPTAPKKRFFHEKFRDRRSDPYHWMRKKDSPEVLNHLKLENKYAGRYLKSLQPLKETLFREMKSRIPGTYDTAPARRGDCFYYQSYSKRLEHPVYKRKVGLRGKEEILLDVNSLAGEKYCDVSGVWASPRQNLLAYAVDREGREFYTIFFKDLKTQKKLPHTISRVTSDFVWANDNKTIFYVRQDPETLRPFQALRFDIFTGKSALVWTERDERFFVSLNKPLSEKYIFICSASKDTSEWRFLPADQPAGKWILFCKRRKKHRYFLDCGGNCFYILTNMDGAFNFKLMKSEDLRGDPSGWTEAVPHGDKVLIEDFNVFEDFIALEVRQKALKDILVLNRKTNTLRKIPLPGKARSCSLGGNWNYQTDSVGISFHSPVHPPTVYDYHVRKRELIFRWQIPKAGGFSPEDYVCHRDFAKAKDGVKIPITLVHRKDLKIGSGAPLFLYGYGSYGFSLDAGFRPSIFSLLDRGFIYAVAHVRGGSEMGQKWHEEGRLLKKKNTFTDFISCAERLIQTSRTCPRRLYAGGGSAGGLLMGAVLNERPDLFRGVIADVPFVDALTTMLDDTIPLSTAEYEEWGNPNHRKYYNYIKSYSPYDNVKKTDYPHIFIRTGYHDPRVQYWEPAKWTARLREFKTNRTVLLFLTDMKSGHFGPTGRFRQLNMTAQGYAFLVNLDLSGKVRSMGGINSREKSQNKAFSRLF